MELDETNRRILFALDEDAFQSLAALSRKTGISKQVIRYRMLEMQQKGILRRCCVIVNTAKIGLSFFKFYLKYKNVNKELESEMVEFFDANKNVGLVDTCDGKYDMFIGIWAKDTHELYNIYKSLFKDYGKFFEDITVSIVETAFNSKRGYLIGQYTSSEVPLFGGEITEIEIDDIDKKLLGLLSNNARMKLVDIAKVLKITPNAVSYRIKQLKARGVIQGARIVLDRNKIGYLTYKVLVKIDSFDEAEVRRFIRYLTQYPNIIDIDLCMGEWNVELDVEIENYQAFHELMIKLRTEFSKLIKNYDSLLVFAEHTYTYYPIGK
ncbi:MAG TPA: Lrp/AsnC family transcriptional regulator [Candidatus Bilamarchaeaceae archaeon]|nr:Lrp/AsnC family transcriptional regulator [Candidatus Bilamarchaeaceae archaeon]